MWSSKIIAYIDIFTYCIINTWINYIYFLSIPALNNFSPNRLLQNEIFSKFKTENLNILVFCSSLCNILKRHEKMNHKQEHGQAKKVIIPWYDTDLLCYIMIIFTILVIGFSLVGISVALDNIIYINYIWMPVTIIILCMFVLISVSIRITKRIIHSFKNRYLKEFNKDTL